MFLCDQNGLVNIQINNKHIRKLKELEVYDIRKYGIATIIFIRKGKKHGNFYIARNIRGYYGKK